MSYNTTILTIYILSYNTIQYKFTNILTCRFYCLNICYPVNYIYGNQVGPCRLCSLESVFAKIPDVYVKTDS